MVKVNVLELRCKRCHHYWIPRQQDIVVCPKCKSPYWDRAKGEVINKMEKRNDDHLDYDPSVKDLLFKVTSPKEGN